MDLGSVSPNDKLHVSLRQLELFGITPRHLYGQASRKTEDISSIIYKIDNAWSKDRKTVGLGWVFSDTVMAAPSQRLAIQVFINLLLIAEALVMRSALCKALTYNKKALTINIYSNEVERRR
ncbi:Uncharacterized protein Rs2_18857 [Raphanus sativus]|nr:Uncharacterized protein Rs2_18857 [Raphanus sativus]